MLAFALCLLAAFAAPALSRPKMMPRPVLTLQLDPHGNHGGIARMLSPDGRRMATLGGGVVAMWDATSGELLWKRAGAAGYGGPYPHEVPLPGPLAWSPDGRTLAGSEERKPVVWDLSTGKAVRAQIADTGWGGGVFSPDGRLLALSLHRLLDLRDGRFITRPDFRLRCAAGPGGG